jgi:hypothetical protein
LKNREIILKINNKEYQEALNLLLSLNDRDVVHTFIDSLVNDMLQDEQLNLNILPEDAFIDYSQYDPSIE